MMYNNVYIHTQPKTFLKSFHLKMILNMLTGKQDKKITSAILKKGH